MAAPAKRRAVNDEITDVSEENEANSTDVEEIQVEFEAHTPEGGDIDGIKNLLQQLFLKSHLNVASLAEIVIQQNYIASVIKQSEIPYELDDDDDDDDDDDVVFGITTVVNITDRKNEECVKQLVTLLTKKLKENATDQAVTLLNSLLVREADYSRHVGWILSERFVNIPPQLAVPLYENLCKEMKTACNKQLPFDFDYFILICKIYKSEKKHRKTGTVTTTNIFSNPEEEFFNEEAVASFEYCVVEEIGFGIDGIWDTDKEGMKPYRRILVIPAEKLDSVVSRIHNKYALSE